MRTCSKCGVRMNINQFYRKGTTHSTACKLCESELQKAWRETHKKEIQDKKWLYRLIHAEEIRQHKKERFRTWFTERWNKILDGYGGKCKICGESRKEALILHHVNKLRGKRPNLLSHYKWVIDNDYPNQIQLLCGTCHTILHRKEGVLLKLER